MTDQSIYNSVARDMERETMSDEEFVRKVHEIHKATAEIHEMLSEVMPAARIAVKMMSARHNLMSRWLGGK